MRLFSLILTCSSILTAQDPNAEQRAFVELSCPKNNFLVQEIIPLRITLGVEETFLQQSLIQPFRQQLSLPLRLEASWLEELAGTELQPIPAANDPAERAALQSLVLNGARGQARRVEDQTRNGQVFRVFEIDSRLLAQAAGNLDLPAAKIQVTYATSFREDFLNGRVPADRHTFILSSQALDLSILPWPEEDRPADFIGAVGQFRIRAEAKIDSPRIGEPFELTLHFEGRGNLPSIPLPRLDDLPGFHVIGRLETSAPERRSIRYELAALNTSISEIPSIAFTYLDPEARPTYRRIQSEAIPISLRPLADGSQTIASPDEESELIDLSDEVSAIEDPPAGMEDDIPPPPIVIEDIADIHPVDTSRAHSPWQPLPYAFLAIALLLPLLLTGFVLLAQKRKEEARLKALLPEPNRAAADFRNRLQKTPVDMASAFAEFIAGRLECKVAAVIRPRLSDRLQRAGIPDDLAARSEALLEALVDRRYDGSASSNGVDVSQAPQLVEDLEARFVQLEEGP
ncbi:MAG: hypothetical protein ACYTG5_01960 [Planctomycetota bacterium]|jgi:hypothetical protein